jgi:tRNA modification GTPase
MTVKKDVIAAIATPTGKGAIGVVRMSGEGVLAVLPRIFIKRAAQSRPAFNMRSHRMYYGYIHNNGETVDEVLCCIMRGPHSYTGEDTAEIYAHGGFAPLRGVLEACFTHGARPAEPGEFTLRAFLNGRLDLAQAEAVAELINAKTDAARGAGLRLLGGFLSDRISGYREKILMWLAHIELSIDYPEHEEEAMNLRTVAGQCAELIADMRKLAGTARAGRIITEGLRTAIIGRSNVGKSSLMNAILREDRAIVTDIPGTTRDVLAEPVQVRGVPLLLADTAGIRDTMDTAEQLGVKRSIAQAEGAELILLVFDGSVQPKREDYDLWARFGGKHTIVLLNKCDLPAAKGWQSFDFTDGLVGSSGTCSPMRPGLAVFNISAKTGEGLDTLYERIEALVMAGLDTSAQEADIITRERHKYLLERALAHLTAAETAARDGWPEDLVSIDLREAYVSLGEILGQEIGDDVLERIFAEFCVGK